MGDPLSHLGEIDQAARQHESAEATSRRERRSLYASNGGLPVLRPSVVAYLDMLGTKMRSPSLTRDQLRSDVRAIDRWQSGLHSEFWDGSRQRFVSFSDNVAIAAPYEGGDPVETMRHQIDSIADFQLQKVLGGRGLRGGVCLGEVFCDGTYIDGPALIEAVELDEAHAQVPRVILSDVAAEVIRGAWHTSDQIMWPNQLVAEDSDGRLFVNYLLAVKPGASEAAAADVGRHRDVVAHQVEHVTSLMVRAKWQWAAGYHDWFVDRYMHADPALLVGLPASGSFGLL